MLQRRAAALEEGAVSAATDNVHAQRSPDSVLLQLPQGSVRITARRRRSASAADPVPAASLPLDADRHGHTDASTPDAASNGSDSDSSSPGDRSESPGIGDGSDADSASAFEFISSIDAGGSGALQPLDGCSAAQGPQKSGGVSLPTLAALAADPCVAGSGSCAAEPRVEADPASDADLSAPPSMRKLQHSMLRRSRELLALRWHSLDASAVAAGPNNAAAGSAASDADAARGMGAAGVSDEHVAYPDQHTDAAGLRPRPANSVQFWLHPPSSRCGMPASPTGPGAEEHPDMQDLGSEQEEARPLANLGADFAGQLLGAQHSWQCSDGVHLDLPVLRACSQPLLCVILVTA